MSLPIVRSHEIADFKRCEKKWFWHWRMGLVPKAVSVGALDLGTWVHAALEWWYQPGLKRAGDLREYFHWIANDMAEVAAMNGAPEHELEKAEGLALLGEAMMAAYQARYGNDPEVYVLATELPLDFLIPGFGVSNKPVARYALKPDMVFRRSDGGVWLMENKTAASIRTAHLSIDGQARPYGVLAARALVKAGIIKSPDEFKGILYNFLRKAFPDDRPTNEKGQYLNQNGSVSKSQPPAYFLRHPVLLTRPAKLATLNRLRQDVARVAMTIEALRSKEITDKVLSKTPHHSCPKFCDYFAICEMEDNGLDISRAQKALFKRVNPYEYSETTEERATFEMG